jgi:hypothetical protein
MNPPTQLFTPQLERVRRDHPGAMVGHHALEFVAPEDAPHAESAMQYAVLNSKSVVVSIRVRAKNGELCTIRGAAERLNDPETDEVYLIGWASKV